MLHRLVVLAARSSASGGVVPPIDPNAKDLPGGGMVETLLNGVASWALIAAVGGIVIGAIIWAFGHYSQNYQQSVNGRKGVMVSGLAALLIGAAPFIVNMLFSKGQGITG